MTLLCCRPTDRFLRAAHFLVADMLQQTGRVNGAHEHRFLEQWYSMELRNSYKGTAQGEGDSAMRIIAGEPKPCHLPKLPETPGSGPPSEVPESSVCSRQTSHCSSARRRRKHRRHRRHADGDPAGSEVATQVTAVHFDDQAEVIGLQQLRHDDQDSQLTKTNYYYIKERSPRKDPKAPKPPSSVGAPERQRVPRPSNARNVGTQDLPFALPPAKGTSPRVKHPFTASYTMTHNGERVAVYDMWDKESTVVKAMRRRHAESPEWLGAHLTIRTNLRKDHRGEPMFS